MQKIQNREIVCPECGQKRIESIIIHEWDEESDFDEMLCDEDYETLLREKGLKVSCLGNNY